MAGQNNIKFGVSFETDQSLKKLEQDLSKVLAGINQTKSSNNGTLTPELQKAADTARKLSDILDQCYNKDLGTTNITKFNSLLTQSHLNLQQIKTDLSQVAGGADAYNHLGRSILSSNLQLQQGNKLLNEMATTMASAAKWSVAYGIMNQLTDTISNAYSYVKQLDTSLTDIRIVTGDSAEEMSRFAEQANAAAKNLGSNTLDYTKSALAFYQQGLDDEAVANRTEATIKAANATGANAQEVAENLTAVWNGFQVAIGDETEYVDKLAAVADSSASNLNELATAMSKVASVANNVGVDMDQLTAQISTIIATTRQAPETVGNALKTIYARINDIKAGSDEAEMSLGNYTGKMAELGISVLDSTGHLRDTGEVMEEIGDRWGSMTREQQIYLAQVMAGQRQMNNMIALFDNWTQYSEMLNVSLNAQGALDEKNARYMESTQAHLNELKSTYQDLYSTIINTNELNNGIDLITNAIQVVNNFLEGFGGGIKSVTAFGTIVAYVFRDQIGSAINQAQRQQLEYQQNLALMQEKQAAVNLGAASGKDAATLAAYKEELAIEQKLFDVKQGLTQEEYNELNAKKTKIGELVFEQTSLEEQINALNTKVQLENTSAEAINDALMALEPELESEEELTVATERRVAALREMQQLRSQASGLSLEQGSLQVDIDNQVALAEKLQYTRAQTTLLTSSFMLMTTAVGTLSSVIRTLGDDNASFGDKVTQLVMSLGFAIPMVITGFNQLKTSYTAVMAGMVAKTAERNALELTSINIEKALTAAVRNQTISEATRQKVLAGEIGALSAKEIAQLNEIGVTKVSIATLIQERLAREVHVPAIVAETLALEGETVALGTLLAALAPYIVILGAVGVAVYSLVKAYNAESDAAREATEISRQAAEAAEDAKTKYENIGNELDSLREKYSTLNSLTKGTREWKAAVAELNLEVIKLLELYPQLANYITNKDGVLTIDPEGYDAIIEASLNKYTSAAQAANTLQGKASQQQARADAQQLANSDLRTIGISPTQMLDIAQKYVDNMATINDPQKDAVAEFQKIAGITESQAKALLDNTDALISLTASTDSANAILENGAANDLQGNADYENASEQRKGFIEQAYGEAWKDISDLSVGQDILGANGEVAFNVTKNKLASILEDLTGITYSAEELEKMSKEDLAEQIINERKKLELAEKMPEILDRAGELAEKASRHAQSAAGQMEAAYDALEKRMHPDTSGMSPETYKNQQAAIQSAVENRNISNKDEISAMQALLGEDMDKYFTLMGDGSYQLIGNAREFEQVVNDLSLEPLKEQIRSAQEALESYKKIESMGPEHLGQNQWAASAQQAQVDYLASTEGFKDIDFLGEVQSKLDAGKTLDTEEIQRLSAACRQLSGEYDIVIAKQEALIRSNENNQQILANSAHNIEELNEQLGNNLITQEQYNEALKAHGANQDVDTAYVEEFTEKLAEEAETLDWVDDSLQDNEEAATGVAAAIEDTIEGIEEIQDKWKDWNEQGLETPEVMGEITDILSDMFNTDVNADFVKNNLEDIERLARGDIDAVNDLQQALALEGVENLEIPAGIDTTQFDLDKTALMNDIAMTDFGTIEAGATIDSAPFYESLNAMIQDSNLTQEQINTLLGNIGYIPDIEYITIPANHNIASQNGNTYTYDVEGLDGEVQHVTLTENLSNQVQNGQSVTVPVIKGSKFKGGGLGAKNLGGNRTTPKSSGGGGGGGGGGGKQAKAPEKKKVKKDPYHDVNIKLKDNERVLKRLTAEEKKLTGKEYLANLQQQNKELQQQIQLQKEKQGIASDEIIKGQKELAKYGFSFNAQGDLTNYLTKMDEYKAQLDALYNAAKAAPSEEANAHYEQAVKDYQEMEKLIQEYEKHVETYKDSIEEQREIQDQIIENSIKRYKYTIDLHIDFSSLRKEWKEFQRDVIKGIKEDDFVNLSSFALSQAKDDLAGAKELLGYVNDLQNRINNIKRGGWDSIYGNNSQQAYEDLEKYMKELMDRGEDIADLQKDIRDNWLDAIDATKDAFEENVDNFDDINDILEHNLDLLDMLYGDAKFDQAAKLYELQARNSMNSITHLVQQRDFWKARMDSAVVGSDVWKEYRDNWKEAMKDVNDAVADSADYMYDAYEAQINNIAEKLRNALYGGNADLTQSRWEHYQEDTNRYLDSIQRGARGLSLVNKYNDALNGKSLKQQKEIQKLQKAQLDNLNNQVEVRQIDYDIAEKELELLLKQQALEDARDNKTKLRLRRDSQGNYRYQYVADQEQINQAERELAETVAELYELSRQDYYDTVSYIQEVTNEYLDRQKEIMTEYANNEQKRNELLAELAAEQAKRIAAIGNDYEEMSKKLQQHTAAAASVLDGSLGGQLQEFINMPDDIYEAFAEVFAPDGEIISLVDGLSSNIWNEGFAKMPENVKQEIFNGFGLIPQQLGDIIAGALDFDKVKAGLIDMLDANQQYQADLAELQQLSNQNFRDLTTNLSDSVIATENLILNNQDLINQYGTMIDQVAQLAGQIDDIMNQFRNSGAANSLFNGLQIIGDQSGTQAGSAEYGIYNQDNTDLYRQVDSVKQLASLYADDGRQATLLQDISDVIIGTANLSRVPGALDDSRYANAVQTNNILQALLNALSTVNTGDQTVNIDANFPGITAAVELETALTNLANQASQAASGNRRNY